MWLHNPNLICYTYRFSTFAKLRVDKLPPQNTHGQHILKFSFIKMGLPEGAFNPKATPLIHPEANDVSEKLSALISNLPDRRIRPVYICVRSYQAWLEPVLEDLGAKAAERQAVMVKHLVHRVKDAALARNTQPAGVSVQPSRVNQTKVNNK